MFLCTSAVVAFLPINSRKCEKTTHSEISRIPKLTPTLFETLSVWSTCTYCVFSQMVLNHFLVIPKYIHSLSHIFQIECKSSAYLFDICKLWSKNSIMTPFFRGPLFAGHNWICAYLLHGFKPRHSSYLSFLYMACKNVLKTFKSVFITKNIARKCASGWI